MLVACALALELVHILVIPAGSAWRVALTASEIAFLVLAAVPFHLGRRSQ